MFDHLSENLFDHFYDRFGPHLEAPFLIRPDGAVLSYGEAVARSAQLANLLTERGVRPGDRVAAQVDKSPEAILLYLACLRAGAVFLPLNTAYTPAEVDFFLGDATPRLVVVDPAKQPAIAPIAAKLGATLDTLDGAGAGSLIEGATGLSEQFETVRCAPDDLAALCYTSGTTGRSKGAMLSHGNLRANASTLVGLWGFTETDVLLHALPVYHVHGLFVATNTLMMAAGALLFLPKFDLEEVLRLLPKATSMMGVPTFYTRLLASDAFTKQAAQHMRLFISGSAPLLEETFTAFEARTGQRILERYGMTETGMNTSNPLDGERRAGTVGPALPDVTVRVTGEDGTITRPGDIGGLEVKGPNVFQGYWNLPDKTQEDFTRDGFFKTGDIARIDADGYVTIVGRAKDLVITGGLNVYPKEIELVLDAIDGVVETAVIGLPHPDFGEAVAAVIATGGAKPDALTERAVIDYAAQRLAKFKVPKAVFFVEALPRNAMGKVQKADLRQTYRDVLGG